MTSRYRCDALTNWAKKPLTLGINNTWYVSYIIPSLPRSNWALFTPWGVSKAQLFRSSEPIRLLEPPRLLCGYRSQTIHDQRDMHTRYALVEHGTEKVKYWYAKKKPKNGGKRDDLVAVSGEPISSISHLNASFYRSNWSAPQTIENWAKYKGQQASDWWVF